MVSSKVEKAERGEKEMDLAGNVGGNRAETGHVFPQPCTHTGKPSIRIKPEADYRLFFQSISIFIPIHNFQG